MLTALIYLFERIVWRLIDFFRHWYILSFFWWSNSVITLLERLDRRFAIKITLRYLFMPLYQDRSIFGYILGFIFRSFRIILSFICYAVIVLLSAVAYFIWIIIPLFLIYRIIQSYD